MIPLIFQNANVFIWNPEDWKKLRQEHRIVGNLFGSLSRAPYQNSFNGLPSVLLQEEVTLLLEKKVCKLVSYKSTDVSNQIKSKFNEYKKTSKEEQATYIIEDKKRSITAMIDRIVEGKKRKKLILKKDQNQTERLDAESEREAVLKAELERVDQTPLNHSLVHIFSEDPWLTESDMVQVSDWKFPSSDEERLRYRVYRDLWQKGYFITCGKKFGGDFLVYPGDPALYHAHYIVACRDSDETMPWLELSSHCRVGASARKTFVIAFSPNQQTLSYSSFQFHSLTRCIS